MKPDFDTRIVNGRFILRGSCEVRAEYAFYTYDDYLENKDSRSREITQMVSFELYGTLIKELKELYNYVDTKEGTEKINSILRKINEI